MRFALALATALLLSGCSLFRGGGYRVDNLNYPIGYIQQVIAADLPQKQKRVQRKGREFVSNYFVPVANRAPGQWAAPSKEAGKRYYAFVTLLGERRPYTLDVLVVEEEKFSSDSAGPKYSRVGSDNKLAKVIAEYLQKQLAKSRKERNIIDDFRVF